MAGGRPTPREPEPRPSGCAVILVAALLVSILAMVLWLGSEFLEVPTEAEQRPEHVITHDSMCATYTYDGEVVRWYVMVDPDTGAQYVYNDHSWVQTPRLDRYGNVMGVTSDG